MLPSLRSVICTQPFHSSLPLFEETPVADGTPSEVPKPEEKTVEQTIEDQLAEIKKQLDASSKEVVNLFGM